MRPKLEASARRGAGCGVPRSEPSRRRRHESEWQVNNARRVAPSAGGYSGTPLPKKLGVRPGMKVALLRAPDRFDETIGELPEGVRLFDRAAKDAGLTIWFVRSARELKSGIGRAARCAESGNIWIAWPKRASGAAC